MILENQKIVFYISMMISRLLLKPLRSVLASFPAVALVGPRQSGKTTLARQLQKRGRHHTVYLDLELPSDLAKLKDAQFFLESLPDHLVILDEAQRQPDLFPLLRALIDQHRHPGRFLLLGSANLNLMHHISESLAGRIAYLELTPLLRSEIAKRTSLNRHWLVGGYPEALRFQTPSKSWQWLEALLRSYLERDLPQLGFRIPGPELRRFLTMLAHSSGQLWNAQQLATSFGTSPPTITHYRSILEQMFLVNALYPWHSNIKKRLVKAPRVYMRDSGVLHSLLGIETYEDLMSHPIAGKSWEGFVIEQIRGCTMGKFELSFYRTYTGAETDLILHQGSKIIAILEIKLGLQPHLTRGNHEAHKDLGSPPLWIITSGTERYRLEKDIEVIGLDKFLQEIIHGF